MPLILLLAGLILVVTGVKGTVEHLGGLIKADFTGPGNFVAWVFAITLAGAIGYIPQVRPLSTALLVMIILAILIKKQDDGQSTGRKFFDQFNATFAEINS